MALVPESVARLVKAGHVVTVQQGAGEASSASDAEYAAAGATLAADFAATVAGAEITCKVQPPSTDEAAALPAGAALLCYLAPTGREAIVAALAARGVQGLALELVPRITRAQSMDVLSSQATVAGYRAVLRGAAEMPRMLPMLTTAAGTIAPAKCFVLGAGVAGLQAIATARRLGAVVSGFDVRPAAQEQIQSLGATVLKVDLAQSAEGSGGYAKAQSEDDAQRTQAAITAHLAGMDLVITTAAIPGRRAPVLISEEAVRGMKPGAVIVDLAAETGGNCALTRAGEVVRAHGVSIIGAVNVPSEAPVHASQMLSRNVLTFLQHVTKDGALVLDAGDEIVGAMLVTTAPAPAA